VNTHSIRGIGNPDAMQENDTSLPLVLITFTGATSIAGKTKIKK